VCLDKGAGAPQNPEYARVFYVRAAKLGHQKAWLSLAKLYEQGRGT
jgi:TPR repeat protein